LTPQIHESHAFCFNLISFNSNKTTNQSINQSINSFINSLPI
jgi:hypothetical protein